MSSRALLTCSFALLQACLAEANPTGTLIMTSGLALQTLGHSGAVAAARRLRLRKRAIA